MSPSVEVVVQTCSVKHINTFSKLLVTLSQSKYNGRSLLLIELNLSVYLSLGLSFVNPSVQSWIPDNLRKKILAMWSKPQIHFKNNPLTCLYIEYSVNNQFLTDLSLSSGRWTSFFLTLPLPKTQLSQPPLLLWTAGVSGSATGRLPVWHWGLASECSGLVMDIIAGCSTYLSRTSVISGRSQATLLMSPYRTITSWQVGMSRSDTLLQPNLNLHAVTGITGRLLQDSAIALFLLQNQQFPAYYVRAYKFDQSPNDFCIKQSHHHNIIA